jgi:hypothetical protein
MLRTMSGFSEPQGIACVSFADSVYLQNGN